MTTSLMNAGFSVHALVRDPTSPAALALASRDVELTKGDFADSSTLCTATMACAGVFSVQLPPTDPKDPESELREAMALLHAAKETRVQSFVQTSVARAGEQSRFMGWAKGRWWKAYWNSKSADIDAVKGAGFTFHTIIKPAFLMENFSTPSSIAVMYPGLKYGRLETTLHESTHLDLIAVNDVARFATAAFLDPTRFNKVSITLAAELLTMTQVAAILQAVKSVPINATYVTPAEARAAGVDSRILQSEDWDNVEGYQVDIPALAQYGIPLTPFRTWAELHREQIMVNETQRLNHVHHFSAHSGLAPRCFSRPIPYSGQRQMPPPDWLTHAPGFSALTIER